MDCHRLQNDSADRIRYKRQLQLYALALQRATGKPARRSAGGWITRIEYISPEKRINIRQSIWLVC